MTEPTAPDPGAELHQVRAHIHRYFVAIHGPDYAYRAPETFGNLLERWMWAVAAGETDFADELMGQIERMAADQRDRKKARQ